jgi:hypothetical protein
MLLAASAVLEAVKGFGDVVGEGCVNGDIVIVPRKSHADEQCAILVDCDLMEFL